MVVMVREFTQDIAPRAAVAKSKQGGWYERTPHMAQHHVEVRVSRRAFLDNIQALRKLVAPAKICVVMKANAYGHGLEALAPVAVEAGADSIGICTNPEAETIRRLGLRVPLLRLRMALPRELDQSVTELEIEEQVGTAAAAAYLAESGARRGRPVDVHIKIDTGMGRGGFLPDELPAIRAVLSSPGLRVRGLMTHFATADGASLEQTERQLATIRALRAELGNALGPGALFHTHNSAATVRLPGSREDMVRVGAACYGVRTSREFENPEGLRPVMSFRSWVAQVRDIPRGHAIGYGSLFTTTRDSRIASLPVGFGEGYPRSLFNKGIVLIHGRRCPVVGRVSLNVTTVDVTDCEGVAWGDEAVLIGTQGGEEITFEEMADKFASVHTEINLMAGFMNGVTYA
jgi:alanine racemase